MTQKPTDNWMEYRYQPSARIESLREQTLACPPQDSPDGWWRGYFYLSGWEQAAGQPLPLRNAAALAEVIENMPPRLSPGELLVGIHANGGPMVNFEPHAQPPSPEALAGSPLSAEQQAQYRAWLAAEPFAWQELAAADRQLPEMRRAMERGVIVVWGTDLNHSIRGYERVLSRGFVGLGEEVEQALRDLPLTDPEAPHRRANLLGLRRLCAAAATLGARHAAAARELAAGCADPAQAREWAEIAEICERVPAQPARTFREAVQALWFAHMITVWEDSVNANGLGRIDQFLWPYLEADLAAGRITRDQAGEVLAALWLKLYQTYDVQQMMIGGQTAAGQDASNPLSYLTLAVTEALGLVRCLSARLHRGSPRELVARCVDLIAQGGGIPFFFNDEALVPALVSRGIPREDALGYAAIGCIEITLPGQASPHAVSHWINLPKVLELALNDGRDLRDGEQIGPRTGTLAEFGSMAEIRAAYTRQLEYFAELAVYGSNAAESAHRAQYRLPYLSLLTADCVARGLDIIEGGARYNYHSSAAMGIPNVADSLAALELAVFTEHRVTGAEMLQALRENFAGREELAGYLRHRLPKYGNDQALPDQYAADLTREYCELLGRYRTPSGGGFFVHLFTFTLMLEYGKHVGASPDGRRAGEALAYSVSPGQGRDREGFTAVLNSLSRLPHYLAAASSSAILEAHPSLLAGAAGRAAFVDLLITAVAQGVGQLQINVVSAETLREAQQEPERFRSLCVRVSGFSQQFLLLDPAMQEHIIARTKHER
ncbi:MAG TPA: pyruvate formate lyase family protein [Armatimonadota bacterium]|jgi:formate C-acetyltransferase